MADGTPHDLMANLPGRTLLVETAEPREAQRLLHGLQGIIAMAQIGTSLRVLAKAGADFEHQVAERLRAAGLVARVHPIAPNLEDVFVVATSNNTESSHAAA